MSELAGLFPPESTEAPLRRALDCLREGFQIIGFDWKYVYVNPAAARHGRRTPAELIGRAMTEAYPGIDQTYLFTVLRRAMEERRSHIFENLFTFPDGTERWFEIRVQPVPEGICVYSADIDARKRAELARAHDAHVIRRTPIGSRLRSALSRAFGNPSDDHRP
jgi:PAS domain S-box-containing protein